MSQIVTSNFTGLWNSGITVSRNTRIPKEESGQSDCPVMAEEKREPDDSRTEQRGSG